MSEIMGKEESLRLFLLLLAAAVATAFSIFCSLCAFWLKWLRN
jgi:hypothetical protein